MFCEKCGAKINESSRFCDMCGAPVNGDPAVSEPYGYGQPDYGQPNYGQPDYSQPYYGQPSYGQPYQNYTMQTDVPYSGFAIAGFVTALLGFGVIAIILCVVGINECKEKGRRGNTLAVVGLVLSIFMTVLEAVALVILIVVMYGLSVSGY